MGFVEDNYSVPWELLGEGSRRTDAQMRVTDPWYRLRMERTLALIDFPTSDSIVVLDLGCGTGPYDFTLARRWLGAHITGVDINQQQVDFARDMAGKLALSNRLDFICADVTSFIPRGAHDVVLLTDIVEHMQDPRLCLATAHTAVRAGGQVIVSVPSTSRPKKDWWFYRQMLPDGTFAMADTPEKLNPTRPILRYWHKEYAADELAALLSESGFGLIKFILCRFDYRYLRRRCLPVLRRLLDIFSDGKRAFKPELDKVACAVMPCWAKTCIMVAARR